MNRRFGGTNHFHLQSLKSAKQETSVLAGSDLLTHCFLTRLIFDPEVGGDAFLRNVDSTTDYTALYPIRRQLLEIPQWEAQILLMNSSFFITVFLEVPLGILSEKTADRTSQLSILQCYFPLPEHPSFVVILRVVIKYANLKGSPRDELHSSLTANHLMTIGMVHNYEICSCLENKKCHISLFY
jgi:hypothetical protein